MYKIIIENKKWKRGIVVSDVKNPNYIQGTYFAPYKVLSCKKLSGEMETIFLFIFSKFNKVPILIGGQIQ